MQEEEDILKADVDLHEQNQCLLTQEEEQEEEEDNGDEEVEYINSVIEPPKTIRTNNSPIGELEYSMLYLEHMYDGTSPTHINVRRQKLDKVLNTFFHFKDRRYNACLHRIVNGLIREWRRGCNDKAEELLSDLKSQIYVDGSSGPFKGYKPVKLTSSQRQRDWNLSRVPTI